MNAAIIKEEMKWLLEAINEQYEGISKNNGPVPQIEYDILMQNLQKLYEDLHLLKRLEDPHFTYERKTLRHETPSAVTPAPVTTAAPRKTPPVPPPPVSTPAPAPAPRKAAKPATPELFAVDEPALNAKLKEAREKTFSPKIPSERIDNLKTAIAINDKFMFINELFEGNLREYNETIETLNGFMTLSQAADYLDLMRKKNFWNAGSPAFKKLKELVERRF